MAKLTGVKTIDMANGEITKISYEGAEYAKVDGEATAGDLIYVTKRMIDTEKDSFYSVVWNGYGDGRFYDEGDNSCVADITPHIVFRKINASQSDGTTLTAKVDELDSRVTALEKGEKPAYKTEKRAAKVGERMLITDAVPVFRGQRYENEDILTVASLCNHAKDGNVRVDGVPEHICYREYVVIVEETPAKTTPAKEIEHNGETYTLVSRKAQAGDVVVFTENTYSRLTNGKAYGPVKSGDSGLHISIEGFSRIALYKNGYGRTEANVLVYAPKAPALKVGDYVRIKDGADSAHGDIEAGTIVKVTDNDWSIDYPIRVELLDESDFDYFNADDLELVDEKVVTFAKIGRKPGEFKKGDIVRAKWTARNAQAGTLFEIERGPIGGLSAGSYDFVCGNGSLGQELELIAPVESRVDSVA